MSGSPVTLVGLWAGYDGEPVLRGVDLEAPGGKITAVLGPSGCGKTTLLKAIAGLVDVMSGHVLFGDRDVTGLPPEKRNVGMVFQDLALFPHMNVYDNVAFGLRVRGVSEGEVRRRVKWALELVGLDPGEFAGRKVTELSGGQRQRVALARALVVEPEVLLMDEPLAHLDYKIRQRLVWELRRLQRRLSATVIYVTHDQWEAMELADKLAVMRDGIVVQSGSPEEVYENPADEFVATFFGDANLVPGELLGVEGGKFIVRPEDVELHPPDWREPIEGFVVEGVIEDRVFQGPMVRFEVRVNGVVLRSLVPRSYASRLPSRGPVKVYIPFASLKRVKVPGGVG
ncbi:MAG: ABC transporter ATP-binding protein [Desulfurococcales archaeon]|nr:ABC transporter ATP-binding protein [Desulfurococcales archaeon]